MKLANVVLDDKYTLDSGRIFLTGIQALVRLPLEQRRRDALAGLRTAGYISGYRGSPVGAFDQQLWRARDHLQEADIHFSPGLNEDLAATAIWGTQQLNLFAGARHDGVFSLWYGKGPGVDRCGDVFKHGNFAGSAAHGGVLLIAGDDHVAKSSTLPHQSEFAFMDAGIPVLNPSGVQEVLSYGLTGLEMSRFSGCWVALKTTAENMDSSASIELDPGPGILVPPDTDLPPDGTNIRWPDNWLAQETRLFRFKLPAAQAFARENGVDRIVLDGREARLGIVTAGKSYLDVCQALEMLGIDAELAGQIGLRLYKVGMPWPLDPTGLLDFAEGLAEIIVFEEKRSLIESQAKACLYNSAPASRPIIVGKHDERQAPLQPTDGELTPGQIARVLASRIRRFGRYESVEDRLNELVAREERQVIRHRTKFARTPYFCSGCPHNTSTRVPEGSRAIAGIGCHFMAQSMNRSTATFTHMGGEGASWIGQAPFTETKHIFANLGDGTYTHSGLLAIRAAAAAKVNITYKILYNDAVAMTGGQPAEGGFSVSDIAAQVAAEGARKIRIVTDDPEKYPRHTRWPDGTTIRHRDELDQVQRELRDIDGLTVLIYDQTCAAEKRRRRKRGTMEDPPKRIFINELVCEGCGDCGVQSNCVSVIPIDTEFGIKRKIDQSSCTKDYSCANGFCPSFVTVIGGNIRRAEATSAGRNGHIELPPPAPAIDLIKPFNIIVTGIGGTGVVTIGALIGMAAHLEEKGVSVLDMTGLAQKGGAVISHVRIASRPNDIRAARIADGDAELMLACDMVTASSAEALSKISADATVIVNTHGVITGDFTRNPDLRIPHAEICETLRSSVSDDHAHFINATALATRWLGDSLAANLFLLGYALQLGRLPLSVEALDRAIELNGVAVEFNRQALLLGRQAAHDPAGLGGHIADMASDESRDSRPTAPLTDRIDCRLKYLTAYHDTAYADRYQALVRRIEQAETVASPGSTELTEAVALYAFKLMAYKDEYEVARLYTEGQFLDQLNRQFEGNFRLRFSLAPPLLSRRDPVSGEIRKRTFGPWILPLFRLLASVRRIRGTMLDPFGKTVERRTERQLIVDYFALMDEISTCLKPSNHRAAVKLASIPEYIRGYGHIKVRHVAEARERQEAAMAEFRLQSEPAIAAE